MKITAVKPYQITVGEDSFIFVKVETDEGIYGLGDADNLAMGRTMFEAITHLGRLIVGEDPLSTERLWQLMFRTAFYPGDRTICSAISGIDTALWDIKGKALGLPVYKLLGGPTRDKLYFFQHVNNADGNIEGLVNNVIRARDEGFKFVRWWLFRQTPELFEPVESARHMIAQVKAVREAVGNDVELVLDFHSRLDPRMAIQLCRELEPYHPHFIEDPIRTENPASYRTLARHVSLPIAAGEHWSSKWQFREVVEEELISIARPDITLIGGLTEAVKLAHMCETHYIDIIPHGPMGPISTAACNHLCFAVPNVAMGDATPGSSTLLWDIFPVQPTFEGGYMRRSEAPGLGIEFNEEAAQSYSYEPYLLPQFRRRDGSYNNW